MLKIINSQIEIIKIRIGKTIQSKIEDLLITKGNNINNITIKTIKEGIIKTTTALVRIIIIKRYEKNIFLFNILLIFFFLSFFLKTPK